MKHEIDKVMLNIEGNIEKCDILRGLLADRGTGDVINYNWYYNKGYKNEEIKLGAELIDLYIILRRYTNKDQE